MGAEIHPKFFSSSIEKASTRLKSPYSDNFYFYSSTSYSIKIIS
jgi:hypothetical protein